MIFFCAKNIFSSHLATIATGSANLALDISNLHFLCNVISLKGHISCDLKQCCTYTSSFTNLPHQVSGLTQPRALRQGEVYFSGIQREVLVQILGFHKFYTFLLFPQLKLGRREPD